MIILYADDILLLAPSVTGLQNLFSVCEARLHELDMAINAKKSCCLRIGPRCHIDCISVTTAYGICIPWVSEMRYLGVTIVRSRTFKCSYDAAKRSFYKAANAIFGKVGRIASEEVVLELVSKKCVPILLYGLEACQPKTGERQSLDFTVNRFLFKLFKTNNITVVNECRHFFKFYLPSELLSIRSAKFVARYGCALNSLCIALSN